MPAYTLDVCAVGNIDMGENGTNVWIKIGD